MPELLEDELEEGLQEHEINSPVSIFMLAVQPPPSEHIPSLQEREFASEHGVPELLEEDELDDELLEEDELDEEVMPVH